MINQQQLLPAEAARDILGRFFAEIRLARATELAQSERFAEAQAVLAQNGNQPETPRELDLLARIAARRGRFEEARRLWNRALQSEPENQSYKECLKSLTPARQTRHIIATHEGKLLNLLVVAVIILVIATLFFVFKK